MRKKHFSRVKLKETCPICGSTSVSELYPSNINLKKLSFTYVKTPFSNRTFRAVRCHSCTHVFCSPLPPNIYKNYEDVVDSEYLEYTESIKSSSQIMLPNIASFLARGARILDVGCATGEFLAAARDYGYKVEGLELSRWSSKIASERGLTIYRQRLESLSKKVPGRYNLITLFGVIEHFEHPKEEIKYIKTLLKPGGYLVVWTGDIDSLPSRILGKNWWYWQGQHIQYFTEKSLNLLAEICDIKHIKTNIYPFVATQDLLDNSLSRYKFRKQMMSLASPFFKIKPSWTFYIPGEMLWFGRRLK